MPYVHIKLSRTTYLMGNVQRYPSSARGQPVSSMLINLDSDHHEKVTI